MFDWNNATTRKNLNETNFIYTGEVISSKLFILNAQEGSYLFPPALPPHETGGVRLEALFSHVSEVKK
jgi:hypothetical protein